MAMEVSTDRAICSRCGIAYGRRKGNFPVCYGSLYKGVGYLHICRDCVDKLFNNYLSQCNNARDAVRQMCRKLDLIWSPSAFDSALKVAATRSVFSSYLAKINTTAYAGKCYDDSLLNEGALWNFSGHSNKPADSNAKLASEKSDAPNIPDEQVITEELPKEVDIREKPVEAEKIDITDDIIAFWGPGYTPSMYSELEQRRQYWLTHLPEGVEITVGLNGLLRQICSLEIDINRARASGASVDRLVTTLNTLIGSAMLKPTQSNNDGDSPLDKTPFGVWIKKWEDDRPIPEPDPQFKDVDNVVRYIEVWFKGHLSKMLGLRNSYSKMYEEEMERYKVELPEYEDEDGEALFNDIFAQSVDDDDSV